jgi:hypothetical protein
MNNEPSLAEIQVAIRKQLVAILTCAQSAVRDAERLVGSIPPAYRQNGLKGTLDTMRKRLADTDELFVGAFKSVHDTYGPGPAEGDVAGEEAP